MTIYIGKMNELPLIRTDDKGGFLDAEEYGEVFLPNSQLPENWQLGDMISVFCYMDDGRLTVTAKRPKGLYGELARLTCKDVTRGAAYLEWGIRKDLMVPYLEQTTKMKEGGEYIVYITKDRDDRLYGTMKFNRFISDILPPGVDWKAGDKVDLIAISRTSLGVKVVVNNCVYGLVSAEEAQRSEIRFGTKLKGVIKSIRPDRKLNISLHALGQVGVDSAQDIILKALEDANGILPYGDKTPPDIIERAFKMSKGKFKKVIGGLYKNKKIIINNDSIELVK